MDGTQELTVDEVYSMNFTSARGTCVGQPHHLGWSRGHRSTIVATPRVRLLAVDLTVRRHLAAQRPATLLRYASECGLSIGREHLSAWVVAAYQTDKYAELAELHARFLARDLASVAGLRMHCRATLRLSQAATTVAGDVHNRESYLGADGDARAAGPVERRVRVQLAGAGQAYQVGAVLLLLLQQLLGAQREAWSAQRLVISTFSWMVASHARVAARTHASGTFCTGLASEPTRMQCDTEEVVIET